MTQKTNGGHYRLVEASIWLILLVGPLAGLFTMKLPTWQYATGAGLIVGFGAVYLCAHTIRAHRNDTVNAALWVLALLLPMIGVTAIMGVWGATMLPYITATTGSLMTVRMHTLVNLTIISVFSVYVVFIGNLTTWIFFGASVLIAATVGTQVSATRLSDERVHLAAELELARQRESIYRDVHDLLGHSLTVINVKASLARKLVDVDKQEAAKELDEIVDLSRQSLEDVRRAVRTSHTPSLTTEVEAARSALAAAGIEPRISVHAATESPLFGWVLREAVTNVIRHSQATECEITVTPHKLVVADNGIGLPPGTRLASVTDRVRAAGGSLVVPPTDSGTRLEVTV